MSHSHGQAGLSWLAGLCWVMRVTEPALYGYDCTRVSTLASRVRNRPCLVSVATTEPVQSAGPK